MRQAAGPRPSADLDHLVRLGGQLDRPRDLAPAGLLDLDLIGGIAGKLEAGRGGDTILGDEPALRPDGDLARPAGGLEGDLAAEGVAAGDVLGGDVAAGALPDHREVVPGRLERGGVDPVLGLRLVGLGRLADEPAFVELARLAGADERPLAVPGLDPAMVARVVGPARGADHPRGDAHGAAGVDQEDRQAGARRIAGLGRLVRALVGLGPLGGVVGDVERP